MVFITLVSLQRTAIRSSAQVSIIYLQAVLSKFSGETWRTGTAVCYAIEAPKYRRWRLPACARTVGWSRFLSWWTIAVELALGPLVWIRELRPAVVAAGITAPWHWS